MIRNRSSVSCPPPSPPERATKGFRRAAVRVAGRLLPIVCAALFVWLTASLSRSGHRMAAPGLFGGAGAGLLLWALLRRRCPVWGEWLPFFVSVSWLGALWTVRTTLGTAAALGLAACVIPLPFIVCSRPLILSAAVVSSVIAYVLGRCSAGTVLAPSALPSVVWLAWWGLTEYCRPLSGRLSVYGRGPLSAVLLGGFYLIVFAHASPGLAVFGGSILQAWGLFFVTAAVLWLLRPARTGTQLWTAAVLLASAALPALMMRSLCGEAGMSRLWPFVFSVVLLAGWSALSLRRERPDWMLAGMQALVGVLCCTAVREWTADNRPLSLLLFFFAQALLIVSVRLVWFAWLSDEADE